MIVGGIFCTYVKSVIYCMEVVYKNSIIIIDCKLNFNLPENKNISYCSLSRDTPFINLEKNIKNIYIYLGLARSHLHLERQYTFFIEIELTISKPSKICVQCAYFIKLYNHYYLK